MKRGLTLLGLLLCTSLSAETVDYEKAVKSIYTFSTEAHKCSVDPQCLDVCVSKTLSEEFEYLTHIVNYGSTKIHVGVLEEAISVNNGLYICSEGDLIQGVRHENQRTLGRMP